METFSHKVDKISENIIYLLSLNSKLTISELSRILSINRRIIENRVKFLYEKGFIKPLLIYNYNKLIKATILIKLTKFDKEVIKSIESLNSLIKLKETLGIYDLSLLIATEDEKELENTLHKINELFHENILNIDVIIHNLEDTLSYKSFCHDFNLLRRYSILKPDKEYNLNKEEKEIINLLKVKPHVTYKELIEETKLGYKRIKNIIDALLSKNIIRFSIDPNYNKLALEFHNILVKINLAKVNEFENKIIKHANVHWIKKGSGKFDYILSIASRNISEFVDITREIRTINKDIIFDAISLVSKINIMRRV